MRTCFLTKSWALPLVRALGTCAKYFVYPIYFTSSLKSTVQKPASKKKNPIFFFGLNKCDTNINEKFNLPGCKLHVGVTVNGVVIKQFYVFN